MIGLSLPVYSLVLLVIRGHEITWKTHLGFWMSSKSVYSEFFLCVGSSSFCSADGQVSVSQLGCEEMINFRQAWPEIPEFTYSWVKNTSLELCYSCLLR